MPARRASSFAVVAAVLGKELKEAVRDAHVLGFSIVFPILFYPMLIWGFSQLLLLQSGQLEATPPRVAVVGAPAPAGLIAQIEAAGLTPVAVSAAPVDAALETNGLDAILALSSEGAATVHHTSTSPRSRAARTGLMTALKHTRRAQVAAIAEAAAVPESALAPPSWEVIDTAPPGRTTRHMLGLVLPGVVLAAIWLGAIYPTVEVVVGERERQTLETTRTAPVPPWTIVAGKIGAVLVLVLVAAGGNLGAMALTVVHLLATLDQSVGGGPLPSTGMLVLAFAAVAMSAVLAAATLAVAASPARTFKQGQNFVSLVATLAMAPGMIAVLPAFELDPLTALVPIANTALLLRAAVSGTPPAVLPTFLTFVVCITLSGVLLQLAARSMLSQGPSWLRSRRSS